MLEPGCRWGVVGEGVRCGVVDEVLPCMLVLGLEGGMVSVKLFTLLADGLLGGLHGGGGNVGW